jgi:3D (Asp-Asp-Asp) domain-containing protein
LKEQETKTSNMIASRGGNIDFQNSKRVEFIITYYSNIDSRLEGGQYDKQGKRLTSHDMPIVALPKDIPYGSIVIFDESINGDTCYMNADSGGAIKWLNSDKTKCKVDIFVPNASKKDLLKYDNKTVCGWLYYK